VIKRTLIGVAVKIKFAFLYTDAFKAMYDLSLVKNSFLVFHRLLGNELWNLRLRYHHDLRMNKWASTLLLEAILSEFAQYVVGLLYKLINYWLAWLI
jgi:hypothetical protein